MMDITYYLKIHFAPSTACIVAELTESQYKAMVAAMGEHHGDVTLEVSSSSKISTTVDR